MKKKKRQPKKTFEGLFSKAVDTLGVTEEKTILEEAKKAVYGDRQADYGSVTENFTNIANMWSVVLQNNVTPAQVGLCMAALKIARQIHKPKRDNLVDLAGYAATLEKMEREPKPTVLEFIYDSNNKIKIKQ